jgi:predicted amidophosphoribosyltransferase
MSDARCPVCGAGFRGSSTCSRCGSDLTQLMRVHVTAWRLRVAGWRALAAGDAAAARRHAEHSLELHASASARRLEALAAMCE